MKIEQLIAAAKELNEVVQLEPPIKTDEKAEPAKLRKDLLEVIEQHLEPDDEISEETTKVLETLKARKEREEKEEAAESPSNETENTEESDGATTKTKTKKKVSKSVVKKKVIKKPLTQKKMTSPYSNALEVMCTNPEMDKDTLLSMLKKRNVDVSGKSNNNAVNVARSIVRKVVSLLAANGLMR